MIKYLGKRLFSSAAVLFILTVLIFFAGRGLVSGSPASVVAGANATPETLAQIEHELGYDRPLITQYFDWFIHAIQGDFGTSPISGLETTAVIAQQAPVSLELALLSLLIAVVIGIPLGVIAAKRPNSVLDSFLRGAMIPLFAVPGFLMGTLFVFLASAFFPSFYSPIYVPITEDLFANLHMMLLPALAVGIPTAPLIMQMTRGAMIETYAKPFVSAARVNGLRERVVTTSYALRASLPPILTFLGFTFGMQIGGLVIVEQIFNLPGLGRGVLQSIGNRDFVQLVAQATVLAGGFIVANLAVDIAIPAIDRRIALK